MSSALTPHLSNHYLTTRLHAGIAYILLCAFCLGFAWFWLRTCTANLTASSYESICFLPQKLAQDPGFSQMLTKSKQIVSFEIHPRGDRLADKTPPAWRETLSVLQDLPAQTPPTLSIWIKPENWALVKQQLRQQGLDLQLLSSQRQPDLPWYKLGVNVITYWLATGLLLLYFSETAALNLITRMALFKLWGVSLCRRKKFARTQLLRSNTLPLLLCSCLLLFVHAMAQTTPFVTLISLLGAVATLTLTTLALVEYQLKRMLQINLLTIL